MRIISVSVVTDPFKVVFISNFFRCLNECVCNCMDIKNILLVSVIVSCFPLTGCVTSPAPGCSFYLIPGPTGCFGKTAVSNVSLNPENQCIKLQVNNCLGGSIRVDNKCNEDLNIAGMHISKSDRGTIEVSQLIEGGAQTLNGKLGENTVEIKYIKRRYCD